MLLVGLFIRKRMPESPDFVKAKAQGAIERLPFLAVTRNYPKQVVSVIFATAASNSYFYAYAVVMVSYAVSTLGMSQSKMLSAVCVAAAVEMCTIPVFGMLSDLLGRRKVFVGGLMVLILATPLFCMAAEAKSYEWMLVGYVVLLGIGHAAAHASQASLFADMFPTSVRYTGLSVSYQTSTAIFSGPLPIVATLLIAAQDGGLRLFFGYTVLIGLVSLVAIMKGKPHYTLLSPPEDRHDDHAGVKASL
jgi:MFS family permease